MKLPWITRAQLQEANRVLASQYAALEQERARLEVEAADQTDRACGAELEAAKWKTRYVGYREGVEDLLEKVETRARAAGMWQGLGTRIEVDGVGYSE